jgi:hypothetical protein
MSDFESQVNRALAKVGARDLLAESGAVVLERIARGGGATSWYFCKGSERLADLAKKLSPGSVVSFYFDQRIRRAVSLGEARRDIEIAISADREAVVGLLNDNGLTIDVELVSNISEFDHLVRGLVEIDRLFYGRFPERDNDGRRAITVSLPDADGIVRPHPH